MTTTEIFKNLKASLELKFQFLPDKPEETIESTLKACWLTASGSPKSAEESIRMPLPDLTEKQIEILNQLIDRRLENIPLAHITGRQNFMGIEFLSDNRALIPRKETEILGRKALEISNHLSRDKKIVRIMDICCGSGNLGLSLACYNASVEVYSTDLSLEAIQLTKDNVSFLNLNNRVYVEQGDMFSAFENEEHYGKTDLVICNPPYISSARATKMNQEISAHEPILAFDGGMFGTKIIQKLVLEASKFLTKNGWLLFEVGLGQGEFILRLCRETNNYSLLESLSDNTGNIRVIIAQKK